MITVAGRCPLCRAALTAAGCPGTQPLLDPHRDGREYGTAHQLAHRLTGDDVVTVAMIRNWQQRDGLERYRVGRTVYSPLTQAASIERAKRLHAEQGGRGQRRQLDATPVLVG
ncbi:hypothetical protein ACFYUR_22005 [Micromonospora haikouensis]|uniref:hypothetical protein n=1 Tax=Micromonospora haikouensis TaxID=686309 RepID=UPI0036CE5EF1